MKYLTAAIRQGRKKKGEKRLDRRARRVPPRVGMLEALAQVLDTELRTDRAGNEYVLLQGIPAEDQEEIGDKTAFEAVANHVHIFDGVTRAEYKALHAAAEKLCPLVLRMLKDRYPDKRFWVYATASLHGSFILRFHQSWPGEAPYYNGVPSSDKEWVYSLWG